MWKLFANPRDSDNQQLIELFSKSQLYGHLIPTSVSVGLPELTNGIQTIIGHNNISKFLRSSITL